MQQRYSNLSKYGGWKKITGNKTGYFHVEKNQGRWWFIDPTGYAFLSKGINHIDCSSLKYNDNISIWKNKYGSSVENWLINGVAADMAEWGFNTVGWIEEKVTEDSIHSTEWTYEMHKKAEIPFCFNLPFANIEYWNPRAFYPDVFSKSFEDWCDYVARANCVDMEEEPYLIGYTYPSMPQWFKYHLRPNVLTWVDKYNLNMNDKEDYLKLEKIVRKYFEVCYESIKRYDKNHLILGPRLPGYAERMLGTQNIPDFVLDAITDTVDIFFVNYFKVYDEKMKADFDYWYKNTGKPILLGDYGLWNISNISERGKLYNTCCEGLYSLPYFLGLHWCGYMRNKVHNIGVKDRMDNPIPELVIPMKKFNSKVYEVAMSGIEENE